MKIKIVLLTVTLLFSTNSYSAVSIGTRALLKLVLNDSNDALISLSGDPVTQGGCSATNYVVLGYQQILFKETYASLLAAMLSGKNVILYVDGCISVNGTTYPKMSRIDVIS